MDREKGKAMTRKTCIRCGSENLSEIRDEFGPMLECRVCGRIMEPDEVEDTRG